MHAKAKNRKRDKIKLNLVSCNVTSKKAEVINVGKLQLAKKNKMNTYIYRFWIK